jgi:F0F1-type ATP synthase epsilon subunit
MLLSITTPNQALFKDKTISGVFVVTDDGPIAILDHHASLVTTSKFGMIRVVSGKETDTYILRNATLQMDNAKNHLTILALVCDETREQTELGLGNYLAYLKKALFDENLDRTSLKYKFLEGERIMVEKQTKK